MKQKLLSLFLIVLVGTSMNVQADPIALGNCGKDLAWVLTNDYELVITGSGAMEDYDYPNYGPWNAYKDQIASISLPQGLTRIGDYAFYQMTNMSKAVSVPEGVTSIGYCAFAGNYKLPAITLPSTLTELESAVFSQASALQALTIPASVYSIGKRLTEGCTSLTSIVVEKDNRTFDSRENCNAIIITATNTLLAGCSATVIPNTVETIGNQSFSSQRLMTTIKIPTSVKTIEDYAFQYCSAVSELTIPSSVTAIGGTAFTGCIFNSIQVIPGNPRYDSRDNCNAIIETKTNILVKGCNNTVIPDEVVALGEGAFMSCRNLKFINIPASVEKLEKNSLIYCNNLEAITCFATEPPAADALAFNFSSVTSTSINPNIPVYVPGKSISAYRAAENWGYFTNFVAMDGYYTVKALATHGKVTGTGTYPANETIELTAVPDEGYAFQEWTDGTNDNPKQHIVTKDETIRALFYQPAATVVEASFSFQSEVLYISWDVVDLASIYIVDLFKNGNFVASYMTTDNVNFTQVSAGTPARLNVRRSFADETPDKVTISIEGLEYGADYSYNIDAYNRDEEVINVIAGSFNTAQVPTNAAALKTNSNAPRKTMLDGNLIIVMPDGKRFDATGAER